MAVGDLRGVAADLRTRDAASDPLSWDAVARLVADRGRRGWRDAGAATLRAHAERAVQRGRAAGLRLVSCLDAGYPELLHHLPDPPLVLWATAPLDGRAAGVAIVGARAASSAALEVARRLARDLASAGLPVISGLARGVDAAAHEGALAAGCTTAVLGSGADVIYPPEHRDLAHRVSRQGAIVSEFVPGTPPRAHHFPRRNRIVAGLALGVVIVEAGDRSGALITAREALDQGKDVMVVPGHALTGRNRGGHRLIKDGAALVEDARDVLDVLRSSSWARAWLHTQPGISAPAQGGDRLDDELATMRGPGWRAGEELDLDEIAGLLGLAPPAALATLLEWELAGAVRRTPAGRFVRVAR